MTPSEICSLYRRTQDWSSLDEVRVEITRLDREVIRALPDMSAGEVFNIQSEQVAARRRLNYRTGAQQRVSDRRAINGDMKKRR